MRRRPSHWSLAALLLLLAASLPMQAAAQPNFTKLVKENRQAVVNIRTVKEAGDGQEGAQRFPQLPEEHPFSEFFDRFFGNGNGQGIPERRQPQRGLGSGFVISEDGYILTNVHVVEGAGQINVHFQDGTQKSAELVGADDRTDIALLKAEGNGLPTVEIGDSEEAEVGNWVLAIGSPFGLDYTATQGIISALGRNLPSDVYVPFIQTDVALNPGNSGGPLFNAEGEVIGVNSMIYSQTGGYMGLSFAVPINTAMRVVEQLKEYGKVRRGWLGVVIQPVSQDLAESFGLDKPHGALIAQVMEDSPAEAAGLRVGDVILEYAGERIKESSQLPPIVGQTQVGKEVDLTILREGKRRQIEVTIQELEEDQQQAARRGADEGDRGRLNLAVEDLSERQRQQLGIGDRGVLIRAVGPGPAAQAGLRPGDVILAYNHRNVESAEQLDEMVEATPPGSKVPVLIRRDGNNLFVVLRLAKEG